MHSARRAALVAIGVVCLGIAESSALILDWSALTWAPGSRDTTYDIDPSKPGTERVRFTGFVGDIMPDSPSINSALEGGQGAGNLSLNLSVDLGREDRYVIITVTFTGYEAVQGARSPSSTSIATARFTWTRSGRSRRLAPMA